MDQELLEADKLTSVELKRKQLIKEAFNSGTLLHFQEKSIQIRTMELFRHNRNALCM